MQTRTLIVNGDAVQTDSEGYLVNLGDWSEDFVRTEAEYEGLMLTDEIWEVIRSCETIMSNTVCRPMCAESSCISARYGGQTWATIITCMRCSHGAVRKNRGTVWRDCCVQRANTSQSQFNSSFINR